MITNIEYPLILDGGLSNVLEELGCDLNHELWSAKLLIDQPELIIKAHLAYLRSGAQCIITSSYQASIKGFERIGLNRSDAIKLLIRSVELALEAKNIFLKESRNNETIYVAASIGPYGAFLADGSEYRGNYLISDNELMEFHAEKINILESTDVDFLAFETIPSLLEVSVLSQLLISSAKPSWVSFSCKDEFHLNDGSKIIEAAKLLADNPKIFAIGVNCTSPKYISAIIDSLKQSLPEKKILVYPNSGEVYHVQSKSWLGVSDPFSFEKMAQEWREKGADIIGGCCRIGPEHIKRISGLE